MRQIFNDPELNRSYLENGFVEARKGHFKPLTEIIIDKRGLKKQGIMERANNKMLRDFFVFGYD